MSAKSENTNITKKYEGLSLIASMLIRDIHDSSDGGIFECLRLFDATSGTRVNDDSSSSEAEVIVNREERLDSSTDRICEITETESGKTTPCVPDLIHTPKSTAEPSSSASAADNSYLSSLTPISRGSPQSSAISTCAMSESSSLDGGFPSEEMPPSNLENSRFEIIDIVDEGDNNRVEINESLDCGLNYSQEYSIIANHLEECPITNSMVAHVGHICSQKQVQIEQHQRQQLQQLPHSAWNTPLRTWSRIPPCPPRPPPVPSRQELPYVSYPNIHSSTSTATLLPVPAPVMLYPMRGHPMGMPVYNGTIGPRKVTNNAAMVPHTHYTPFTDDSSLFHYGFDNWYAGAQ